jgi:hypothetical protein
VPRATPNLPPSAAALDLDAEIARAFKDKRPVVVLVADSGQNDADAEPKSLLNASTRSDKSDDVVRLVHDLSVSRNRATAARFHITDTDTPLLVCLSPRGVIVSRDEKPITRELILKRTAEAVKRAPQLDAKLIALEEAAARDDFDAAAHLALADFLLAQQNAREAIPHLAPFAHSFGFGTSVRLHAWIELARAHFWIGEPEKGRHEASDLIDTMGPKSPEALAAGNLVLGLQDANAKRTALARQEFAAAVAAAPKSTYAKQAAEALAKLPKVEK